MSDIQSGARAPAGQGPAREAAGAASEAASNVAGTAKEQARDVINEASTQARSVAADVRDKVSEQARSQNDRLADGIRRMADELDEMRSQRGDSPAATVVSRVADSGRRMADYLAERGPEGVLDEVQDFARRRPGAFLAAALATGFVVAGSARASRGQPRTGPGTGRPSHVPTRSSPTCHGWTPNRRIRPPPTRPPPLYRSSNPRRPRRSTRRPEPGNRYR